MGANVNVGLFTTEYLGITPVIQCLSRFNFDVRIAEILTVDDWQWNGEKSEDVNTSSEKIQDFVLARKIVWIYLQTNEDDPQWKGGCALYQIGSNLFQTSLFLDTTNHESFFDSDLITEKNRIFYDIVTNCIIATASNSSLVLAGMGIEISIKFSENIVNTISPSIGVTRWIAWERLPLQLEHYLEQQIGSAYVYTITNEDKQISYIPRIEGF